MTTKMHYSKSFHVILILRLFREYMAILKPPY